MTVGYAGWNKFHPAYHTETDKYEHNKKKYAPTWLYLQETISSFYPADTV
jgi:hypothetical protein